MIALCLLPRCQDNWIYALHLGSVLLDSMHELRMIGRISIPWLRSVHWIKPRRV